MADNTAKKQRGRPFQKGQSGNPKACPLGSRHKASMLAERLLETDIEEVIRAVIAKAKEGDMTAAKIIVERLVPPRKHRPVSFSMPTIETATDAAKIMSAILSAVAGGDLTPSEASEIAKLIDSYTRALEASEFEQRLRALEEGAHA
jgi:hypothetical protein